MNDQTGIPTAARIIRRLSDLWPLGLALAIGALLRTRHLSEISLWFDESFSLKMAGFSIPEIWDRSAQDTHTPLYFYVLKGWMAAFGRTGPALRSLSVVCGLLTIVGAWLFLRESERAIDGIGHNSSRRASTVGAVLVALAPLDIAWSVQVRMYALGGMLAVCSAWFLLRAIARPAPRRLDWCLFTLSALLLAYVHHYGLFTVAAEYLAAFYWLSRQQTARQNPPGARGREALFLSATAVLVAYSPWLPVLLEQRTRVQNEFWTRPITSAELDHVFNQVLMGTVHGPTPRALGTFVAGSVMAVLLLAARSGRAADLLAAGGAALPVVAGVGLSLAGRNVLVARYLLFAWLFAILAIVLLLSRIPVGWYRTALTSLILAGSTGLAWRQARTRAHEATLPGLQAAVQIFDDGRQSGEPLVACNPMLFTSVVAYSRYRDDCYAWSPEHPFYQGSAVMTRRDYLPAGWLDDPAHRVLWVLDARDWYGANWTTPIPSAWQPVGEWSLPEYYCGALLLKKYARSPVP